ncbi:MAG TPA: FHA domain-containing protein [Isosphaeraceae bacterium]|nr:FHA domain-containing protein [Isosphaeraceae bacterium]
MRTWIIGSGADCDLVVERPTVSGRHCRLTETADGYLLEDLGSSNGTYVNGARIASATRVSTGDTITLGLTVPMPWPAVAVAPAATVWRIGRDADNDIVLDDPRVSGRHARLLVVPGSKPQIQDLGSSNGTFLNSPDRRVTQAIPLTEADIVYFGSLAVPAARLLNARPAPPQVVPPPIPQAVPPPLPPPVPLPTRIPAPEPAPAPPPVVVPVAAAVVSVGPWPILLLAQAPALGLFIVLVFGRQAAVPSTAASWPSVAQGVAATTFALALAAVWLGGSLAAWASFAQRSSARPEGSLEAVLPASPGALYAILVALCVMECGILLAIVHWGSGLNGSWPAMFGVLGLASMVVLLLGLVVSSLMRNPATAVVVLLASFLAMTALGGGIRPMPSPGPVLRMAAAAMPSRWAFEGLLLLEAERRPAPMDPQPSEPSPVGDLAEDFFPAETERMGPSADAMALGCMLVGLAAALALISERRWIAP